MKTIIEHFGKYYLAKRMDENMKDKCLNCPLNSQCADEEGTSFCEEYGLQHSMYIEKEIQL
jgi:hypothetical protein